MKNIQEYTGKLIETVREKTSAMGNPRYTALILTDSGYIVRATTTPNSALGYSVTNYENKNVTVETKISRGKVALLKIKEVVQ